MSTSGPGGPGGPAGPAGSQGPAGTVPCCPRHPDRESYVRCQRCGRPTCPECQRAAAVGIQCVDCVAQADRGQRRVRTAFGGAAQAGRPTVTLTLVGLCVAMYLLQLATGGAVTRLLSFRTDLAGEEPWRYLTSAFLHSPGGLLPLHLLFNMYALWLIGPYLEQLLGRGRFLALYLLSALAGSVGFQLVADLFLTGPRDALGASGAVFGLFGALVVVQRQRRLPLGQIGVVLAINAVLGFVLPGIAWEAHLGGFVVGLLAGVVLVHAPRDRRTPVQVAGLIAIGAVLVALAVLGTALVA